MAEVTMADTSCTTINTTLEITVGFQIYAITVMCFLGWMMLCFFLPTGLWAFPFDLIGAWVLRPKPMKEDEFNRAKADLAKKVRKLLEIGKKLVEDKKNLQEQTKKQWAIMRWRNKR